ncbi:ribose 5-phosphate isomerase B [Eggerthella sinensis]|uniref:ribose 5-phosphate isomerase B n=1 Tax=Eggerthella sinensis TaxID=242230 RepID=UPI0022DFCD00|nr:ribose 5-phosphate isomerase B [Eggerthella sinensis]
MKISIASDHAGFEQKQALAAYLESLGHDVIDRGPGTDDRVDYPDFAALVAHDVVDGAAERGVLVCGTGIGMAVAANKIDGIRAANVTSPVFAALAREHNDANIVAVSALRRRATNREILDAFVSTEFGGGRHADRVKKITALENE